MNPFTKLASAVFAAIALAHLYRIVRPFEVTVGGGAVPQWVSVAGLIVAGVLSLMLWRESRTRA